MLIADAEVTVTAMNPSLRYIVIASDGIWDVLSNRDAVNLAKRCRSVGEAAKRIVDRCLSFLLFFYYYIFSLSPLLSLSLLFYFPLLLSPLLLYRAFERGSCDNLTAMVIRFM